MDFNQKGKQYQSLVAKTTPSDYGVLCNTGAEYLNTLETNFSQRWSKSEEEEKKIIVGLSGALERLSHALLYSRKIGEEAYKIYSIQIPENTHASFAAKEACCHFESFLFHGKAALDKAAHAIGIIYKNIEFDTFKKLPSFLEDKKNKDARAVSALELIQECKGHFLDVWVDPEGGRSLRSILIHKKTLSECIKYNFVCNAVSSNEMLWFDCIVYNYPLFQTTWNLTKWLTYFMLKIVSLYGDQNLKILPKDCLLKWEQKTVDISNYQDPKKKSVKVTLIKFTLDGMKIESIDLNNDVLKQTIKPKNIISPLTPYNTLF